MKLRAAREKKKEINYFYYSDMFICWNTSFVVCLWIPSSVTCLPQIHLNPQLNITCLPLNLQLCHWSASESPALSLFCLWFIWIPSWTGERGGSVVECRTPEREVRGSRPTAAVLCPWARHFTPRKYWLITQEAMAPSRHDWKIVYWDVKLQHNQPT